MDFNRNPLAVPGDAEFDLDRLDPDVRAYLQNAGALMAKPIDRLRRMNPLSIELYKRYKYDITRDPLEFAVLNQHMNGGLAADGWGATSLEGCYAVGEAAGTHGVTRPGGAALNAGQVFGTRCAEHVAARRGARAMSARPHRRGGRTHSRCPQSRQSADCQSDPEGCPGSHERSCSHTLQCGRRETGVGGGAGAERDHSPARNRLFRRA
jgi:hypothetical protein